MSFTGSGTFVINTSGQPVVSNTVIDSSDFNALTADLALGLTQCITKDGQTTTTGTIPIASISVDEVVNSTGLASGVYDPTFTGVTNIDSVSLSGAAWSYQRVGDFVVVSGPVDINTTAAGGTASEIGISLPIASDFTNTYNASGVGVGFITASPSDTGIVLADLTNNRASLFWNSSNAATITWAVTFQYRVL